MGDSATATGQGGRRVIRRARQAPAERTASRGGPSPAQPELGERTDFPCPVCVGGAADATYKLGRDGDPRWFVDCRSIKCPPGARYLDALAEAWGLSPGQTPDRLAAEARARFGRNRRRDREPEPLPVLDLIEQWAEGLGRSGPPLAYLTDARGLSLDVVKATRVGWDGRRLVFPMFDGGELVAAKWRLPKSGEQMRSWAGEGRAWPLYPLLDSTCRRVLVVAGDLDALRGLSAGLPVVSVTLGAGQPATTDRRANAGPGSPWWRDDWTEALRDREVIVCFDNNEQTQARECVRRLHALGIAARRIDLRNYGLDAPKGDLSDYLNGGGDPARLLARRIVRRSA